VVFTHKGMWNEVQENIRKQAARLGRSRVSQPGPKASGLRNQAQPTVREARTANAVMVFRVSVLICAGMNARMKFGTLSESKVNALTVSWTAAERERTSLCRKSRALQNAARAKRSDMVELQVSRGKGVRTSVPSRPKGKQDAKYLSQQRRLALVQFSLYFGKLLYRRAFLNLCPLRRRGSEESRG